MIDRPNERPNENLRRLAGKTLCGRYYLTECIGEGGFGAVFKSEQRLLGLPVRRVAVKLSKQTGIDTKTARELFADAFLLAQAMDEMTDVEARSHLVQVYDLGIVPEEESRGFIVMEYVQGTDLRAQFTSLQKVPAPMMQKWACQMCLALRGLHMLREPVLHRDLKPENILLGIDLAVRLIDFGLAARMLEHGYAPGVVGTPIYMSPETMKGTSLPASDVYSVGLLLYEGLTGKHPFAQLIPPTNMPASIHSDWLYEQKKIVRPVPPLSLSNTVTAGFNDVILRCLEFNPRDRYRSAGELLAALQALEASPLPQDSLDVGRSLRAAGDLASAHRTFEDALGNRTIAKEKRFALLRELGEVLVMMGEHCLAADYLVKAWELTRYSAILRTRRERAELLDQIAKAYRQCDNNEYQARRYEALR